MAQRNGGDSPQPPAYEQAQRYAAGGRVGGTAYAPPQGTHNFSMAQEKRPGGHPIKDSEHRG